MTGSLPKASACSASPRSDSGASAQMLQLASRSVRKDMMLMLSRSSCMVLGREAAPWKQLLAHSVTAHSEAMVQGNTEEPTVPVAGR